MLSTDTTMSETTVALQAAIQATHCGFVQVHKITVAMAQRGAELVRACRIVEVCQPKQAKKVLDHNMCVSTALPCRISIYKEDAKTALATFTPTTLLAIVDARQRGPVALEAEDTIVAIMKRLLFAPAGAKPEAKSGNCCG